MNVFRREMKANLKSLIFWSIGMLFMIIGGMGKYATYAGSGQSITELLSQIPSTLRAVLGFGDFDLRTASGFYGMLYLYLLMMTTIHASLLGAGVIAKEERDKTTEFLMVKPVSRSAIITAKLSAGFLNIAVLNLVTLGLSISIVGQYSQGEAIAGDILILMAGMFIIQTVFLFVGAGISAVSRNPKTSASVAMTVLLAAFLLSIAVDMNSGLDALRYLTPFKYFEAAPLIATGGFEAVSVILSLAIVIASGIATYYFYNRRDLNV
jgi:ABC-2 type transport system permease protein